MEPEKIKTQIRYMGGYHYQLSEDYSVRTKIFGQRIETAYLNLKPNGLLTIKAGYCWDGASGPMLDTSSIMRGSLIHDALYQLLRLELLPGCFRKNSDRELYRTCREDGMGWTRSRLVYLAVRMFGRTSAAAENRRVIREAP